MSHTAKVLLNCDISYKDKIIFENKQIYFYADIELSNICWDGGNIDYFNIEDWDSEDKTYKGDRAGYLYALNINDWSSDDIEVEEFDPLITFEEFTFLVKSEEFEQVEIDCDMFEPDYD